MKNFNDLSRTEKNAYLNSVVEKRKEFYNYLNLNNYEGEKVFLAISLFLKEARKINFNVYGTHLLNFISLVEFFYTKTTGKIWTQQLICALKNGPIPNKLKQLVESNNKIDGIPFIFEKDMFENGENIKILLKNDGDLSHYKYILGLSEIESINKAIKLMFDLKTSKNVSDYFNDNSISWNKYFNVNANNYEFDGKMNFLDDIENEEDRAFSKIMYER